MIDKLKRDAFPLAEVAACALIAVSAGSSAFAATASVDAAQQYPDVMPPVLQVSSPLVDGQLVVPQNKRGLTHIIGVASDDRRVVRIAWKNDQGGEGVAGKHASGRDPVTGILSHTWTAWNVPLILGLNTLTFDAFDESGHRTTVVLPVWYGDKAKPPTDKVAPVVRIGLPTGSGAYVSPSSSLSLSGTASDNVGVTQVTWSNDKGGSGTASLSGGTLAPNWAAGSIALKQGTNTLTVTAQDAAANATTSTLVVTYGATGGGAYYMSPTGSNSADCKTAGTPCKSFATVFGKMAAGDELILLDGTYSAAAGTGTIHWDNGANSGQPPSGTAARSTYIHALNPGKVKIQGGLFLGRSFRKDSYIKLQGMTFSGDNALYNTSFVEIKDVGFDGPFGIGTNDGTWGNTDNLIEDVWIWAAKQRIIAINYRAHRNVWRRVVVRGDGCGTSECSGSGNPNVGFTVYDSHDVSVQNMLLVDRILLGSDEPYADFASAQHSSDATWVSGRNEWLGSISLNAPDIGFYLEPDYTTDPTFKVVNSVVWNAAEGGLNLARKGTNNLVQNVTVNIRSGDAVRIAPELTTGAVRNMLVQGSGRYAINSAYGASYVNVNGSWSGGPYNQGAVSNIVAGNPRTDGSLKYLTRIEAGSPLSGKGSGGADIGANVVYRYGADGKRFGDTGYNTLGTTPLWPWPNQARIKAEMCATVTRGFCSTGKQLDGVTPITLSSYVWEALGNRVPAGMGQ